jgi:predicted transcriptional regulator
MRALDQKDVVRLLRSEVNRAGSQQEWAKENGVAPSSISMVLSGERPPNKKIISALKLRRVVAFERVDE